MFCKERLYLIVDYLKYTDYRCHLTGEAPQVVGKHQLQSQPEFYHLCHQKDKRVPSKSRLELLHHLRRSGVGEPSMQVSPERDKKQFLVIMLKRKIASASFKIPFQNSNYSFINVTWSNGAGGLPRQKFDNVQVAFLSIDRFECSFSCANNGIRAP